MPATPDNSRTSLDWAGVYDGVVPCADCDGMLTSLMLNNDRTYVLQTRYLGKGEEVQTKRGSFTWNEQGNIITLGGIEAGTAPNQYLVGEHQLTQLDMGGAMITGKLAPNYILRKSAPEITNKYWKLVEVMGKPVAPAASGQREAHMILRGAEGRVTGNAGCNTFTGTFELMPRSRVRFGPMAATKMACPGMETEELLFKALQTADGYHARGDSLQLIRARMAPLARFVAVYLR